MHSYTQLVLLISLIIFCSFADENERKDYPRVITLETTIITFSEAQFNGELISEGSEPIVEYGFFWGTSLQSNQFDTLVVDQNLKEGKFSIKINKTWQENDSYYVIAYVKTPHYTSTGERKEFVYMGKEAQVITSV